ncbi:MAG: cell division protein FtsQ [Bacteroidaceae bacterium]|nr:cell division protein FtsQ [Bacteroidaceae bacterium]
MRRVAGILAVILLAGYMIFSLVRLTASPKGHVCGDVVLRIQDSLHYGLLNRAAVLDLLDREGINPIGKSLDEVNLDSMEKVLEMHPLIMSAQCYRTVGDGIRIKIRCSVPLVRVMSGNGSDYWVDSNGRILESLGCAVNVPVATGNISRRFAREELLNIVRDINSDQFWKAQVEQITVDANGNVELVPRVGNHVVQLGKPENTAEKLDRVFKFYEKGLDEIGWNKYRSVSAAFDGQIVCRKR